MATEEITVQRKLAEVFLYIGEQEWAVFAHTDAEVRYKQVFTGMFEVEGRWCVLIRALSKTDTVGVSAYTEEESSSLLIFSFLPLICHVL